jgi:hypothetical protein
VGISRGRLSGAIAIAVVVLTASAALGAVGALTETEPPAPPPTCAPTDEPVVGEEPVGEEPVGEECVGEECVGEECEEPTADDEAPQPIEQDEDEQEGPREPSSDEDPDADRRAACEEVAGVGAASERSEDDRVRSLANAIEHVLANCTANPRAPGLLTALERLRANQERHEVRGAEHPQHGAEHPGKGWGPGGPHEDRSGPKGSSASRSGPPSRPGR